MSTMTRRFVRSVLTAALLVPSATSLVVTGAEAHPPSYDVEWVPCPEPVNGVECGTLDVPLDWSQPAGETVTVAVARRQAENADSREGVLYFNPGGPGDGAVKYVLAADRFFSATLRERFDIVGMDPRGVGASTPVTCALPVVTATSTLWPRTEEQFAEMRAHGREVGESCLEETGELLGHVDTMSAARDHEALRLALGEDQVSWFGLSYGTQLAANYADLFPGRTRAMALDAALEHSLPEGVQVAAEAQAAEDAFERFAAWCAAEAACALHGQDVGAVFDELVASADDSPIPVAGALRAVTGEDIRMGTIGLLRFKEPMVMAPELSWVTLSQVLAAALTGDARAFAFPADVPQTGLHAQAGIGCMEYVPQVHTWAQMRRRIELGRHVAPHLQGASETWQALWCIDWPLEASNPPRTLAVEGAPTLIVHATHDPSVPYAWAHSLADQIAGSIVLTREGDGHTSYYTSTCAQEAVDAFLAELRAPDEQVCD
jgi:pimeloyl-ACP methyl ester carboxylesterase